MTPQQIEAMKLALDFIQKVNKDGWILADFEPQMYSTIAAIKEALAQPEQEPVAYTTGHCENHKQKGGCQLHNLQCGWPDCDRKPITAPPQRKPLSASEIVTMYAERPTSDNDMIEFARAIEAAHGIKENT